MFQSYDIEPMRAVRTAAPRKIDRTRSKMARAQTIERKTIRELKRGTS